MGVGVKPSVDAPFPHGPMYFSWHSRAAGNSPYRRRLGRPPETERYRRRGWYNRRKRLSAIQPVAPSPGNRIGQWGSTSMDISGSYRFDAPAVVVWARFMDPEALAGCLPGVDRLEAVGPNAYQANFDVRVGPIRTAYTARITLHDLEEPSAYRMRLEANGRLGFANGEARVTLVERDGATVVTVEGQADVGGAVARVGQRMMGSVAQNMMNGMFECLQKGMVADRG